MAFLAPKFKAQRFGLGPECGGLGPKVSRSFRVLHQNWGYAFEASPT